MIKSLNDLNSCLTNFTKFNNAYVSANKKVFSDSEAASHIKCMFLTKCNSCRIATQLFRSKRYSDILSAQKQLYIFPVQGLRVLQDTGIRFPNF